MVRLGKQTEQFHKALLKAGCRQVLRFLECCTQDCCSLPLRLAGGFGS